VVELVADITRPASTAPPQAVLEITAD
jgi:hypothetical protein